MLAWLDWLGEVTSTRSLNISWKIIVLKTNETNIGFANSTKVHSSLQNCFQLHRSTVWNNGNLQQWTIDYPYLREISPLIWQFLLLGSKIEDLISYSTIVQMVSSSIVSMKSQVFRYFSPNHLTIFLFWIDVTFSPWQDQSVNVWVLFLSRLDLIFNLGAVHWPLNKFHRPRFKKKEKMILLFYLTQIINIINYEYNIWKEGPSDWLTLCSTCIL